MQNFYTCRIISLLERILAIKHFAGLCRFARVFSTNSNHGRGRIPSLQDINAAFLVNLAVDNRSRKRGFGSALLKEALVTAQQQLQAHRVYAHVDGTNPAACSLYERVGFERCCCPIGTALQSGEVLAIFIMSTARGASAVTDNAVWRHFSWTR